jgi:hypothetical protein
MKHRALRTSLGVLLALTLMAPLFLGGEPPSSKLVGSVRSRRAAGRAAAFFLLQELGRDARIFERPPALLPRGSAVLWLARPPFHADEAEGRYLEEDLGPQHAPERYLEFVEAGGTLVLPATEGCVELLVERLGLGALAGLVAVDASGEPKVEELLLGEEFSFEVEWGDVDPFAWIDSQGASRPLVQAQDGRTLVLRLRQGEGSLLLLSDDRFLDNGRIDHVQNADFFLGLVDDLAPGAPILFDEYALGSWRPVGQVGLAFGERFLALSAQLCLLMLFFLWRLAWVREFPHEPVEREHVSPLASAEALVSLYGRAGRSDLLGEALPRGAKLKDSTTRGERHG